MRRPLAVIVVCIAAGIAAAAALTGGAHPAATTGTHIAPLRPAQHPAAPTPPTLIAALTPAQIRATATEWVTAMWTRRAGQGPFDWLNQVAPITSPGLLAQLHTALPTGGDQLTISVGVAIDGVYASAVDPDTVTVTCDAHIATATGTVDQPCATTVTVAVGADGQAVVTDVQ